ncbi:NAD-dependent epimerase/dehydratase family protein [Tardiphaga sp. vice278]|uniref:NAD-dependent epimerase/dehydratase family protein n=1 Tax=Tardiphaga sp. vice278 TaxID=2592815 RepID=UPI001163848D|nr:NAD(P)-dependent oxidoreductase [Tardiphaga sp. vice278]QDM17987.1 NAD(P)-dependent oxidoreductase [Tardiphaga sp. vice278]
MTIRIAVTGAAGLVGQNIIPRLKARGYTDILAIDKHPANTAILRKLHPDITVIEADLAHADGWQEPLATCDVVVISHAQIGGIDPQAYTDNNVTATRRVIDVLKIRNQAYVVGISSSVLESAASDWYTESKSEQERIYVSSGLSHVVLRPTLMFGWFDRKHVAWLSRFMQNTPVFPVPGDGAYLRQPLYAGDLCDIIMSCIERRPNGQAYNISGLEKITYIDLMRTVKDVTGAKSVIVKIPYGLFYALLRVYAVFDRDPPFTTKQLEALVTPDIFEVIDWPGIFDVKPTPLKAALQSTFQDPKFSKIVLEY